MYRFTDTHKNERPQNPRSNANIFEIVTFSWMFNLFKIGRKRELEENELYTTLNDHSSSLFGNELEQKWRAELVNAHNSNRKPSLLRALIQMFSAQYLLYGFCFLIDTVFLRTFQPLLIGGLLSYFNPEESNKTDLNDAYIYASGLVISMLASLVLFHSTEIEVLHCGMKMRIACCSAIYRKALRLSRKGFSETSVGQIINLMSNDVNRFDISLHSIQYLWIGPLQTIVVTYFLWQEIGVSSLFGIATLLFFIPLQGWFGKQISTLRSKIASKTDERVRLMNEIISGIHMIKMYTWEKYFADLIKYARKEEIRYIKGASYIKSILLSFIVIQSRFQLFISILSYVLLGNYISIRKVFVITSFYNLLTPTMSRFFCRGMEEIAELLVSIKRIENFFLRDEKDNPMQKHLNFFKENYYNFNKSMVYDKNDTNQNIEMKIKTENLNDFGIVITNATAKWTNDQTVNALENINIHVIPDRLFAVIGPVGAGKSSLFQAILHELPLSEGNISINGIVSYASQEPWLFAGTVQQNIIFDSPMDTKRYKEVVKVCALKSDFKKFPLGDKTMVGERGVSLSGGQRARINLARAVYKQADIYLLDDPLSAVDSRVSTHLFEKCIRGYLKQKTCILITHQIQYLANVDQIVLMENASIVAEGTYKELQASGYDFTKLLGSPEEVSYETEIQVNNKNRACIDPILSLRESNESISSSTFGESKFHEDLFSHQITKVRSFGHNSKDNFVAYFSAGSSKLKGFFFFCIFIFSQILTSGGDYWISFWVNQEEYVFRNAYTSINTSTHDTSIFLDSHGRIMLPSNFRQTCVVIYVIFTISMILAILIQSATFVSFCMAASVNLHNMVFSAIIRAKMWFFDLNSSGSSLNSFTKDVGAIDETLPRVFLDCFQTVFTITGIIIVVGLINIYLMIPTIIMGIIFYYFRNFYLPTSRSVLRLEGYTRSPLFAHLNASIQGLTTLRVHGAEQILSDEFDKYQDLHSTSWYLIICSNEALGVWLDAFSIIYVTIIMLSFLIMGNNTYGGDVGLVLTQVIKLIGLAQWGIRQSVILENQMISVERLLEYSNSPQEVTFKISQEKIPLNEWPNKGQIIFKNFNLRYTPVTPYVLKNLNFEIRPMEKVGIVGRTGAGKSSIVEALFRFAFNEGNIIIDGVEIHKLGLHDLRSKLSIIPQEPLLFSGTMRKNLDPYDEYPDHVLWNALDEVELKALVENLPNGLDSKITDSGSNFSVGQRQLVCLARTILHSTKVLVLDEATANIDHQTDALIQNTIRKKFQNCTVLTIAHRLNTVMNSDKILVMDNGTVVEFDHPYILLKNTNGFLYKMVEQTGQETADLLHRVAKESFKNT